MYKVNRIKSAVIFPFVQEIFETGGKARITVTGTSMYPFLRDGIDSVELSKTDIRWIRRGDIVLARRDDGAYVLHRVWSRDMDAFYMVGDAQMWIDGPYRSDQLIAAVHRLWRKEREVSCKAITWRVLTTIWLWIRPFRGIVARVGGKFKRLVKRIIKK